MKTFRFLGIAIAALFMTVNFTSCNNEGITPEDQEEKYIEVDLACTGEILDVTNSPLSKVDESHADKYDIEVFSLTPMTHTMPEGGVSTYYQETRYAYGEFYNSLDGVKIRLLEGLDYKFKVYININAYYYPGASTTNREFTYTTNSYPQGVSIENEGYYGELDKFTPVEGESVRIETKRVSYGVKMVAEDLTEGTIDVLVSQSQYGSSLYSIQLTPTSYVHEKIYSFYYTWQAWKGLEVKDDATGNFTYVNYSTKKYLNVTWTKADGSVIPLGTFDVTFERNVKTTIRIKAEEAGSSNGITVIKETNPIVDGDKEYVISGGTVTEVPVNSGN